MFYVLSFLLLKGAVLGPGEFFEGLTLGGRQFFEGTVGKWLLDNLLLFKGGTYGIIKLIFECLTLRKKLFYDVQALFLIISEKMFLQLRLPILTLSGHEHFKVPTVSVILYFEILV